MRGITLPARLRRLARREVPDLVGRDASALLAAPVAAPAGPRHAARAGTQPYPAALPADRVAAYQRAIAAAEVLAPRPGFEPAAGKAPETAPMAVIADGAPADVLGVSEVLTLRRIRDGISGIDWDALDAARAGDGLTYARVAGAPLHNALQARWRPPLQPVRRHGEAVKKRAKSLAYPEFDVTEVASYGAYAKVMEHADLITGTHGTGLFRPALPAGSAQ